MICFIISYIYEAKSKYEEAAIEENINRKNYSSWLVNFCGWPAWFLNVWCNKTEHVFSVVWKIAKRWKVKVTQFGGKKIEHDRPQGKKKTLKACPRAGIATHAGRLLRALWSKERSRGGWVNNAREREGECQVDIVDGDNAAEIAGEQRGLTMTLLADERASERIERVARGQGLPVYSPAYWPALRALSLFLPLRRTKRQRSAFRLRRLANTSYATPCVSHGIITIGSIATPVSILVN